MDIIRNKTSKEKCKEKRKKESLVIFLLMIEDQNFD